MNLLHQSVYFTILHHESEQLFQYTFSKNTEKMSADEYINELKVFIDLVKKYKPKYVLGDMIDFGFVITPEIQEWVNANLFTIYQEIGFKKIAILLTKAFIESLAIQQTMDEDTSGSFQSAYFDNEPDALKWLGVTIQETQAV